MNTEFSLDMAQRNRAMDALDDLVREAYDNSEEHGFHKAYDAMLEAVPAEQKQDVRRTIILAKLGLIASEVGEAVQAIQHGDEAAFQFELADILIRVFDLAGAEYIQLGPVTLKKMQMNRKREYLHGKKC